MTVHPWFCVFPEGKILGRVREHPEWLIISRNLGSDGVIFFSSGSLKSEFLTKLNASN